MLLPRYTHPPSPPFIQVERASSNPVYCQPDSEVARLNEPGRNKVVDLCLREQCSPGGASGCRTYIQDWFFGAALDTLSRKDVGDWLSWGVFSRRRQDLTAAEVTELESYVSRFEHKANVTFSEAQHAADVPSMKLVYTVSAIRKLLFVSLPRIKSVALRKGRSNPSVASRCSGLLPAISADAPTHI